MIRNESPDTGVVVSAVNVIKGSAAEVFVIISVDWPLRPCVIVSMSNVRIFDWS